MFIKKAIVWSLCLLVSSVYASPSNELQINGDFYKLSSNEFKSSWQQTTPSPSSEIAKLSHHGVELTSGTCAQQLYSIKTFPVKAGENYKMDIHFTGKGTVSTGYYGNQANGQRIYFKKSYNPWKINCSDRRIFSFKIPATSSPILNINIFAGVAPNSKITIKYVKIYKMTKQEANLCGADTALHRWHKQIQGVNLAKNIKCTFIPKSDWKGTANNKTDEYDLTDGNLIDSNQLWHYAKSFVWHCPPSGMIFLDLKQERALEKLVLRINGGKHTIKTPKKIEVFISKNGKEYYLASSLTLVNAAERSIVDWKSFYYLPHSNKPEALHYVYPFALAINAQARYLAIRITKQQGSIAFISDELAVIQATPKTQQLPKFNQAYNNRSYDLAHKILKVKPRNEKIYIARNLIAPQWFRFDDRRENKNGKIKFILDVPKGIKAVPASSWGTNFIKKFEKQELKNGRNMISFVLLDQIEKWKKYYAYPETIGPFYFKAPSDIKLSKENSYAKLTILVDGKTIYTERFPIILFNMPVVPKLKKWSTSLFIHTREAVVWPKITNAFKVIGFTDAFFFTNAFTKNAQAYYTAAKQAGLKIRIMNSAGPWINRSFRQEAKCINAKSKKSVCPAYRGPGYKAMLDNISKIARYYKADYFGFDQESWEPQELIEMGYCSRCDALRKKMKMTWQTYKSWVQADYLKPFKAAVAQGTKGHKMPQIGYYAISPYSRHSYGNTEFLGRSYLMDYFDEEMPSFYGRDTAYLSKEIKKIMNAVKNVHTVIPFITPGAYDEDHIPNRLEQTIIEVLVNGANGFCIYWARNFKNPRDYQEIATALSILAPYEEFINSTKNLPLTGSNPKLTYSARGNKDAQLLLIGNYNSLKDAETTIQLPSEPVEIIDLKTKEALAPNKNHRIKVKADRYRLFYVKYKG
jgi:hypothetical protein